MTNLLRGMSLVYRKSAHRAGKHSVGCAKRFELMTQGNSSLLHNLCVTRGHTTSAGECGSPRHVFFNRIQHIASRVARRLIEPEEVLLCVRRSSVPGATNDL